MLGIILIIIGTVFGEVSSSMGKWNVNNKSESIYTLGFLNIFWVFIIFTITLLFKGQFVFNIASIPLFIIFIILEIAQTYSSLHANVEADRSTFGFLMVGTIPLLLLVDIFFHYSINLTSLIGISLIVMSLLFLFINHGLNKKGIRYVIFSTFNAVATISIYKYLITNYTSVEALQFVICIILLVFLFTMAILKDKENPFKYIFKKKFLYQSVPNGIGNAISSLAYLYAPASVIVGARRGTSVLASIVSGNKYFHEKHIVIKIISFILVIIGLILLIL